MNERQLQYLEKTAEIYSKEGLGNQFIELIKYKELIGDLLFCEREWKLQRENNDPSITGSYGKILNAKEKQIREPVITKIFIDLIRSCEIEYPNNAKFAVCLTHDVDEIYPPASHAMISSVYCIRGLKLKTLKDQFLWKYKGKDFSPYRNFNEIIDLEEKYNAKSSFYFLASAKDIKRFRYNIEDAANELQSIIERGCEVGLHGSYFAYDDYGKIVEEKDRLERVLGKKVIGYRNHYLKFKVPNTWRLLENAGFKYDTTFGYNDMVGFRNGMCHPIVPFDLNADEIMNILEIPLIIEDGTLISYIRDLSDAWNLTKKMIDTVERYRGIITLSWHSNNFNCPFRDSIIKLYNKILKYSYNKKAWLTRGEEIYGWWKDKY